MIKAFFPHKTDTLLPLAGRRFAIGDIHGCLATLRKLVLEIVQITPQDQLFLLGDYINRGPDSAGVLDFIINLQQSGYQVYPLRGNHEAMLLESWADFQSLKHTKSGKSFRDWVNDDALVTENHQLMPRFENFLNNLPYYYELDDFYLVHAGFDFEEGIPHGLADFERMLWVREFIPDYSILQQKPIVHGHVTCPLDEIKEAAKDRTGVIPLDNGCYKSLREIYNPDYGNLCGLNLDTFELIVVENIDQL